MKKFLSVLMLTVIMMVFAGCGGGKSSDAPVVGEWKLSSVDAEGVSMDVDQYAELTGSEVNMELSIKDNGKFTANFQGESGDGKWEYNEPVLTLSSDGESMTGEYKDGKLVLQLEESGQTFSMTFEK